MLRPVGIRRRGVPRRSLAPGALGPACRSGSASGRPRWGARLPPARMRVRRRRLRCGARKGGAAPRYRATTLPRYRANPSFSAAGAGGPPSVLSFDGGRGFAPLSGALGWRCCVRARPGAFGRDPPRSAASQRGRRSGCLLPLASPGAGVRRSASVRRGRCAGFGAPVSACVSSRLIAAGSRFGSPFSRVPGF